MRAKWKMEGQNVRKSIAMVLSVLLLICSIPVQFSAAASGDVFHISFDPDKDVYRPGDRVKVSVTVTNNTGKTFDKWNVVPSLDPNVGTVQGGDLSTKLDKLDNKKSTTLSYTLVLNDDISRKQDISIRFAAVQGVENKKTHKWTFTGSGTTELAKGEKIFVAEPYSGIAVMSGRDAGTKEDVKKGLLKAEFNLKNFENAQGDYSYEVSVTQNGKEITAYKLTQEEFKKTIGAGDAETAVLWAKLDSAPTAGASYAVTLTVTDDQNHVTKSSVEYRRENTGIRILPKKDGPYEAGTTVGFNIYYTAGKKYDKGVTLKFGVNDSAIGSASGSGLASYTYKGKVESGDDVETYVEIKIPEDHPGGKDFALNVKAYDANRGTAIAGATDDYFFDVIPLTGVRLLSAEDVGSDTRTGTLKSEFALRNYSAGSAAYSYDLKVYAEGKEIPKSEYTVIWEEELPGGDGLTMDGKSNVKARAVTKVKDKEKYSAPYKVVLSITDTESEVETHQSITLEPVGLEDIIPKFFLEKGGLDLFYYGNVAKDEECPFNDASSLRKMLTTLPEKDAKALWDKYKYDLYDPNCFAPSDNVGSNATSSSGKDVGYDYNDYGSGKKKNDYPRFEDDLLAFPKDRSNSPFHTGVKDTVNPLKYSLDDGGINFDKYFKNLKKTAGPDDGEKNTERAYTIQLSAETNPMPISPKMYVFQIQTSWQMFDMLHANATKTSNPDAVGLAVGSCSKNTAMANLYDVKKALIRFAEYLKKYDDGSSMIAITNVQHTNTHSMVSGKYFTNDMDALIQGLYGWDSFGDCEHVHYSSAALDTAIANIPTVLQAWKDKDGKDISSSTAQATCILIGGPTENTNGTSGYGIPLSKTSVTDNNNHRNSNLQHVYGIRVNEGTNVDNKKNAQGKDIISWLDIDSNQELFNQDGNGFYVAPSEDEVFNSLVDIFQKSNNDESAVNEKAVVNNVKLSDTVKKDFVVNKVTACYRTKDAKGNITDAPLPEDAYTVSKKVNSDGSTDVEVIYKEVVGKKNLVVKIDTKAKDDFLGSNNVYTNVNDADKGIGPNISDYTHTNNTTGKTTTYGRTDFTEKPQVNVPLKFTVEDGLTKKVAPGTEVNIKDLAFTNSNKKERITKDVEELVNNGYQINGTLTYQWYDKDGKAVGNPTQTPVRDGKATSDIEIPNYSYTATEADRDKEITYTLRATFTPEDVEERNVNKNPVLTKSDQGSVYIGVESANLYELPSAGGPGTYLFTFLGTLMATLAAFRMKRKES